jgi:hypothetical protein
MGGERRHKEMVSESEYGGSIYSCMDNCSKGEGLKGER